ncbi:MAG TPA: DUF6807 family protein [Candidatus Limnocylindrales bacterium]|nr:DUF6807 family protein [Candidatus Limnocylindrales bacterium]
MDHVLTIDGLEVATYVVAAPRPYLHPIKTLGGTVVTDIEPEDHKWHMGLSLAVQDVNGTNLWGGRTYVRGQGYTWLDDHGTITHESFESLSDSLVVQRLAWRDKAGSVLLNERRTLEAAAVNSGTWSLTLSWELTAVPRVTLGSPTTNGREHGAGYGGCFLRLASAPEAVSAGSLDGEEAVNGCEEPEIHWRASDYSLRASGAERWFVRTSMYPGICDAWAFEKVRVIEAGETWSGSFRLTLSDV